jgi:uncharacterized protein (TIGR00266 family)
MQCEIQYGPAFAAARVVLDQGESIKAEAGAMLAMTSNVEVETSTQGGMLKGLKRAVMGGESFFMNTFTASGPGAEIYFAPSLPGDVVAWELAGQTMYVQSGSYLASAASIDIDTHWGGAKTFFSREGLFVLKVAGTGDVLLSSYGAIHAVDLAEGQQLTVDTGHLVAWAEGVGYEVRKIGNWKSTMLSGEGLVCDLTGPGRVYLQTRSQSAFLDWLIPHLPQNHTS